MLFALPTDPKSLLSQFSHLIDLKLDLLKNDNDGKAKVPVSSDLPIYSINEENCAKHIVSSPREVNAIRKKYDALGETKDRRN